MSEAEATAPVASSPKKPAKGAASKKPRSKPSHPKTAEMVNSAIKNLKERGGSSLQAIKKYITANYKVDAEKLSPFIKKYLKSAVGAGKLVQTKGKGASGSFKLASKEKVEKAEKKPKKKTAASPKKAKPAGDKVKAAKPKAAAKKPSSDKKAKPAPAKKPAVEKKVKAAAPKKVKSPSKAKKATKAPAAKKPKAPKPKKAAAKPKSAPKKK